VSKLTRQLTALKDHPQAGWESASANEHGREVLMNAIGGHVADQSIDAQDGVATYFSWNAIRMVTRPVTAGALVFVLLLGGWMTTAQAASVSLPGDTLYGLKLVTERVQVAISSAERRAVLHTEFAQRRLDEVTVLQSRGTSELVPETMEAFREQLQDAQEDLLQLKDEGSNETIAIASAIDQKVDDLHDSLASLEATQESVEEVDEAILAVREVSDSAVETIVDAHETEETEESIWALEQSFRSEYSALVSRQTFDAGRIVVIEQVLREIDDPSAILNGVDLDKLHHNVDAATDSVARAMDLAAASGYRAAFEILREADQILLDLESQLAQVEFAIMNQESSGDEPVEVNIEISEIRVE
jgi:hypothetical protein